ncbi:helix-turn-helix transcriptional regulator [Paractinoplanes deccanensis]|uniref:Helix-turn-helix transcriptional regulator n=1 Tax=Paractinoplanes deccanensis TaxID=113561 RepID=A0ABQ3YBR5_9ACTN|nr:LuxR family transcriptional regulator [Actinoplanes deccanensis]GID77468.1 helix-turn-helix transcriptional regulator [Actinoplanes deccanensis]
MIIDRLTERAALDDLLEAARGGESRVLVLRGAAGIGKTALIQYAETAATGLRILRTVGIESEMELAFAALHQLVLPLLDRMAGLPVPRREALEIVFRMREGAAPDPFLVGLAVLDLLSDASEHGPMLCVVDDAQWLDRASAQVLGFVARRLLAESIVLLFAARVPGPELRGLPELEVAGLRDADAHALLGSVTHAPLDRGIRDRIIAETHGNPLALIELPRGLTATRMAGGLGLLTADTLPGQIEESFLGRVRELPAPARLLLLVAAAEPVGDPDLVRRAAARLGVPLTTGGADGLLTIDHRVTFRHPLVRSAVYRSATPADRRAVHLALAEVTDRETAPDRRAWHLAAAATGPDEEVAAELERSAGRAQARGGVAAAAAFLQRAVALTAETPRRSDRMLAAAEASLRAGEFEDARRLVSALRARPLDAVQGGRAGVLDAQLTYASAGGPAAAIPLLLAAAGQFAKADPRLARQTFLHAWAMANLHADRDVLAMVSRAIRDTLPPGGTEPLELIVDAVSLMVTDGRAAAAGLLAEAAAAILDMPLAEVVGWGRVSTAAFVGIWDMEGLGTMAARQVRLVREAGALQSLPENLIALGHALLWAGDFEAAAATFEEGRTISEATRRTAPPPYIIMRLRALQGREAETTALVEQTLRASAASGVGTGLTAARWSAAILHNGLARYPEAVRYAREAEEKYDPWHSVWILPELIEAASRTGEEAVARDALDRLVETTAPFSGDFPAGLQARNEALLADGDEADRLYREAIDRLGRTRLRTELARAHLLYGEWLRRHRRRAEARQELRTAYEMFVAIGMDAFAERARRELLATGESVRKRTGDAAASGAELTAQERQIALLVRDGYSNPEVGERLFLSPRTVEWHLRKVFAKLGIDSRRRLRDVLPPSGLSG